MTSFKESSETERFNLLCKLFGKQLAEEIQNKGIP
jgi:hypothetical protein